MYVCVYVCLYGSMDKGVCMYVCMVQWIRVYVCISGSQFHKVFRHFEHTLQPSTSNWGW
jgi:hypothetical protein